MLAGGLNDDAQGDKERIQGTWIPVSVEDGGKPRDVGNDQMVIDQEKLVIKAGNDTKVSATYALDPKQMPKWIDLNGR